MWFYLSVWGCLIDKHKALWVMLCVPLKRLDVLLLWEEGSISIKFNGFLVSSNSVSLGILSLSFPSPFLTSY